MKKLIFALMSVVFLASFTACSTDDDGIVGNNDNIENPGDNNGGANFGEFLYNLIQQDSEGKWLRVGRVAGEGMIFNIDTEPYSFIFSLDLVIIEDETNNFDKTNNYQEIEFKPVSNNTIEITNIKDQGHGGTFDYFEVGDIVRITFPSINDDDIPVMTLHNPRVDGEYNHHELYWKAKSN